MRKKRFHFMHEEKIGLLFPCEKSWKEMTPAGSGKHCSACNQVVKDFTRMSLPEIQRFFSAHEGKKICGRYRAEHVSGPNVKPPSAFRKMLNTVFVFLGISLLIQSCIGERTPRNPAFYRQDSTVKKNLKAAPQQVKKP
ncbi:MAG TPA: hypothetical protein VFU15_00965 [Bacteroidia bacterium]|nr:hypothetical protein [Bacteroidia bacterium]